MPETKQMRGRGPVPPMGKGARKKGVLKRLMGMLFRDYKLYIILIALCIVLSAVASAIAGPFLQQVYSALEDFGGRALYRKRDDAGGCQNAARSAVYIRSRLDCVVRNGTDRRKTYAAIHARYPR